MKTTNNISKIALAPASSLASRHLKVLSAGMAVAAFAVASPVQAQYTEINIGSQANTDLDTYSPAPGIYPPGGSQLTVASVPFAMAELNNTPNTWGIVQAPSGGVLSSQASGPFDFTFSVPKGIQAQALYCLMDSVWGEPGLNVGSIVVKGTSGETATLTLTEGVNIRDCHNDGFENGISDPTVVSTYFANGATTPSPDATMRLDRQELVLPSAFNGDTIASIDFEGTALGDSGGDAFLAGLTLEAVPEPSALTLLAVGIAALGTYRLKRRGLASKATGAASS
ncbi:MAG TPA: PEP-CTERM sorting domain-containing protein [Verrucomicrobiae bacterium]|jgi:hypothetical protein|nr:PEP-CTERM sorting domain-containing protein [Verrucomicrobiae bacterium]